MLVDLKLDRKKVQSMINAYYSRMRSKDLESLKGKLAYNVIIKHSKGQIAIFNRALNLNNISLFYQEIHKGMYLRERTMYDIIEISQFNKSIYTSDNDFDFDTFGYTNDLEKLYNECKDELESNDNKYIILSNETIMGNNYQKYFYEIRRVEY